MICARSGTIRVPNRPIAIVSPCGRLRLILAHSRGELHASAPTEGAGSRASCVISCSAQIEIRKALDEFPGEVHEKFLARQLPNGRVGGADAASTSLDVSFRAWSHAFVCDAGRRSGYGHVRLS